ncbi:MAG: zinc metallopeptidase [Spirochaetaceae bacterium]|nr:MAG: zinc metallopeptidase [Spirochaetaceae bacterium]
MPFVYGIDPLYIAIMAPVLIFSAIAQFLVKHNFNKYSEIAVKGKVNAAGVAKFILEKNGINDVSIVQVGGFLSDHYSPGKKQLALSPKVYGSNSIAALGVAAHEAGHAIQHGKSMLIMRLWLKLAGPAAFASNAAIWLIIAGAALQFLNLAYIGVIVFAAAVVFQIITLPLEFGASNEAKRVLLAEGFITQEEKKGVNAVLNSAAMTYVAAAIASIAQLLYFIIKLGLFRSRN